MFVCFKNQIISCAETLVPSPTIRQLKTILSFLKLYKHFICIDSVVSCFLEFSDIFAHSANWWYIWKPTSNLKYKNFVICNMIASIFLILCWQIQHYEKLKCLGPMISHIARKDARAIS